MSNGKTLATNGLTMTDDEDFSANTAGSGNGQPIIVDAGVSYKIDVNNDDPTFSQGLSSGASPETDPILPPDSKLTDDSLNELSYDVDLTGPEILPPDPILITTQPPCSDDFLQCIKTHVTQPTNLTAYLIIGAVACIVIFVVAVVAFRRSKYRKGHESEEYY